MLIAYIKKKDLSHSISGISFHTLLKNDYKIQPLMLQHQIATGGKKDAHIRSARVGRKRNNPFFSRLTPI